MCIQDKVLRQGDHFTFGFIYIFHQLVLIHIKAQVTTNDCTVHQPILKFYVTVCRHLMLLSMKFCSEQNICFHFPFTYVRQLQSSCGIAGDGLTMFLSVVSLKHELSCSATEEQNIEISENILKQSSATISSTLSPKLPSSMSPCKHTTDQSCGLF